MNLFSKAKQYPTQLFLIAISLVFFLLRLPSLVEPYWYGDEGIYEVIGAALRQGRILYTGIWDNKPPLLYYIYGLFNGDQNNVRFFSLIVGLATVITFFFLAKKILMQQKAAYLATMIFTILFATPILEGNIANAENFMLLPASLTGLLVWKASEKHTGRLTAKHLFIPGILLGISFLIKVVAVFDFAAFFVFLCIVKYTSLRDIKKLILPLLGFISGFILPILFVLFTTVFSHSTSSFIKSAFMSNVGYVGYGNYFLFPQGLLITKLFLLAVGILILFIKRRNFSKGLIFIFCWFFFSLFSALFSQRPYTHYLLVLLPAFSLYLGLFVTKKHSYIPLTAGIVVLFFILFLFTGFHPQTGRKLFGYYVNFSSFIVGEKPADDYISFFDKAALRDYKLAQFINFHKKPGDSLFVWGNDGQLYKLTDMLPVGKYIVAYHISSSEESWNETAHLLALHAPTFIAITGNQFVSPISLSNYKLRLVINGSYLYEKVF